MAKAYFSALLLLSAYFGVVSGQLVPFRMFNIFTDEMVLQRGPKSAAIWGYGQPGSEVRISYESHQISSVIADDETWSISLPPHGASGMIDFAVQQIGEFGMVTIPFKAQFGDVWVCSGQSNMAMPIEDIFNATEEAAKVIANYQNFRLLRVAHNYSLEEELDEVTSFVHPWTAPTEENVHKFSAMCILFAERMSDYFRDVLNGNETIPFGLIDVSWPGTRIEAWSHPLALNNCAAPPNNESNHNSNSALWNAMIHPLTKTSVTGAIWFQGENNLSVNRDLYSCHLLNLINDWKRLFFQGAVLNENGIAFPFGIIQIGPNWINHNYNWGDVRWQQTMNHGIVPNSDIPEGFFAATYDLTDHLSPTGSIHPRDKQTIADRLSSSAKRLLYNDINHSFNGPFPVEVAENFPGSWTIKYDRNVKLVGEPGFAYKLPDETYELTNATLTTSDSVTVTFNPQATQLLYAFSSYVCEYKECAIYSDDWENLPAQPWIWQLV